MTRDLQQRAFVEHLKQLFNPVILAKMREHFETAITINQQAALNVREQEAIERGESSDKVRMQMHWFDIWQDLGAHQAILKAVRPYTYVTFPPQVRNIRAHSHKVPWHQDVGYMRLLGSRAHQQVITCFVPLEPDPSSCTTIQFALDVADDNKALEHVPLDNFGAGIKEANFKQLEHYNLQLGDALLFGDHAVHRTFLPAGCQIERRSLEFRLIYPGHAMGQKDYFDLEKRTFIQT